MTAAVSSIALLLTLAACSTPQPSSSDSGDGVKQSDAGSVTLFAPSDGITMSQKTPLNKWAKLVPQITSDLEHQGMAKKSIDTHVANGLDEQSQQLQDWVVEHVTSVKNKEEMKRGTLIVAPASQTNISSRQYGDYVSQTAVAKVAQSSEQQEAEGRMRSALQLAKKAGMHVVLVSNTIEGFTPDAFVRCSTPEQIGELQANMLVNKLDLNKVGKGNPKAIEVLLPYDETDEHGSKEDTSFAQHVFRGIWQILGPYFKDGKAVSPSGTLTASTDESDWQSVAFESAKDEQIKSTLAERLGMDEDDAHPTRIDGIISCNDYVAKNVADELNKLGYTGSSADVNPSITISGIMDSITGKKDLEKKAVPDSPNASTDNDGDKKSDDEENMQWPIITGYGAYISSMPNIVNGKQWMTAMENRKTLAKDIARTCVRLNVAGKPSKLDFIVSATVAGKKTPTIHEDALAISAGNLKKTLIEPNYISLADAGL